VIRALRSNSVNQRVHVILNPAADHGQALKHASQIEAVLDREGIRYEMVLTQGSGHALELARQAVGHSLIVAAGGDGTVNEVVNGLMRRSGEDERPELGVIPIGRGNDFAYSLGVPHDVGSACDVLLKGGSHSLDVGLVIGGYYPDGRYFANGIGIGFDTLVGLEAAKATWIPGFLGYLYGALKMLFVYPRAPLVRIEFPRGEHDELLTRSHQISVMNGRRMGGAFYMAPAGRNNDGLLDLCMTNRELSRGKLLAAMMQYLKGSQGRNPAIFGSRAEEIHIRAEEGGLACHADGETVCIEGRELHIRCLPGALRVRRDGGKDEQVKDHEDNEGR